MNSYLIEISARELAFWVRYHSNRAWSASYSVVCSSIVCRAILTASRCFIYTSLLRAILSRPASEVRCRFISQANTTFLISSRNSHWALASASFFHVSRRWCGMFSNAIIIVFSEAFAPHPEFSGEMLLLQRIRDKPCRVDQFVRG